MENTSTSPTTEYGAESIKFLEDLEDPIQFLHPRGFILDRKIPQCGKIDADGFGLVRHHALVVHLERTKEQIVDAMCKKYDAPRERIETDVEMILEKLRGIGALDE